MTVPPPPGQWGSNQPSPPPGPPQQGPPPGYYPPPGPWGGPPHPPPKQNNTIKWLLAGVGVLLIIAITVGVTVLVTRGGDGGDGPTTTPPGEPIASADDDGPVEIITLEPTCQAWMPVSNAMARVQNNGWGDRDPAIPVSDWTAEQRGWYEAVAKSLRQTADQAVSFARETPNRQIRELYEQFVYFARAYADSVPTYSEKDNYLAQANLAASIAIDAVCQSITYGSAAARANLVAPVVPPADLPPIADPRSPTPVTSEQDSTCDELISLRQKLIADTAEWVELDPNIEATDWTPEQRTLADNAALAMSSFADQLESIGQGSGDSTFQDLASFGAVYVRAYVGALPTYVVADSYLSRAGSRANNLLIAACQAAAH